MNIKKSVVIIGIVVAIVVGLIGGYFWGYAKGGAAIMISYAPKIAAINKLFPVPSQTFSLSGQVENINGDIVTIDANPLTPNPFAEGNFPVVRTVTVTGATVMTRMERMDPAVLQKETEAFQKTMQGRSVSTGTTTTGTANAAITLPALFSETGIAFTDLKIGDTVTVTAASNIASDPGFLATKIQVMPAIP